MKTYQVKVKSLFEYATEEIVNLISNPEKLNISQNGQNIKLRLCKQMLLFFMSEQQKMFQITFKYQITTLNFDFKYPLKLSTLS